MPKYTINTECGIMNDIDADSIDAAKEIYSQEMGFDFDALAEFPGSWYWIEEDGVKVESIAENMP